MNEFHMIPHLGPVGMTWQMVVTDVYGLDFVESLGYPVEQQCAVLLRAQLQQGPQRRKNVFS